MSRSLINLHREQSNKLDASIPADIIMPQNLSKVPFQCTKALLRNMRSNFSLTLAQASRTALLADSRLYLNHAHLGEPANLYRL